MPPSHINVKHISRRCSAGRRTCCCLECLPVAVYALLLLLLPGGDCVATVSCGYGHTCALMTSGGGVRCWGLNGALLGFFVVLAFGF